MSHAETNPPPSAHILIVEDDFKIADMLVNYLHMHGHTTRHVTQGLQAVQAVREKAPDLVLLDLMLPGMDGMAVCRELRAFSAVPIVMVTARVDEIDRLQGLDTGADDYICKPFSPREVVARIHALLRRAQGRLVDPRRPPSLVVDSERQAVNWQGQPLALTPVEYRLLSLLMARPGQVFPRAQLLDQLHEDLRDVSDRAIDSHIKNLRRKLEQAGVEPPCIASVYGTGYRFERRSCER
jgi:two-component system response regulator BaeR